MDPSILDLSKISEEGIHKREKDVQGSTGNVHGGDLPTLKSDL